MNRKMPDKIVESETYGKIVYVHVATFTVFPPRTDKKLTVRELNAYADRGVAWSKKYHPRYFFSAALMVPSKSGLPENEQIENPFYLFLPLREANLDWLKNNPDCKYMQDMRKHGYEKSVKRLPIGDPISKLQPWLKATEAQNQLVASHV